MSRFVKAIERFERISTILPSLREKIYTRRLIQFIPIIIIKFISYCYRIINYKIDFFLTCFFTVSYTSYRLRSHKFILPYLPIPSYYFVALSYNWKLYLITSLMNDATWLSIIRAFILHRCKINQCVFHVGRDRESLSWPVYRARVYRSRIHVTASSGFAFQMECHGGGDLPGAKHESA